ncbi:hypothetical protein F0562_026181 [Nyssa sinensis]|uniref:Uncharacterized protein n=1 Tax=Nyssa sinensis TaxID=561372 RepID=A0A5J5BA33_9ASTE|nr:hypothetical protein F0562_026181 [Nyssa sinensis]
MSSEVPERSHGSFESFKFSIFPIEKTTDFLKTVLKVALLVCAITSISLFLYSAFTSQTRWFRCPECSAPTRNTGQLCESRNVSADNIGPTNISHIIFGIGGSMKTWKNRRRYSEIWWQPNVTRGFVWLDEKPATNSSWPENSPPYRVSEDWTRFKYSSSRSAVRMARIVLESFRLGLPDVRWFVMGDDDTVFFTENFVSVLAKYDHRQMYYIGGNSESVEQDEMHSYGMAFGGGGIAISYSLAVELVNILDGCLDRYYKFYGSDQRIAACVSEIGVSLTTERGFHQMDIREDPYGLLAAHPVAPLVSLHHLDAVKPLFPNQNQIDSLRYLIQAYQVDPARTMQQSFCYHPKQNWSVSISWGYTAQLYPWLLTAKELETPLQTFRTWRSWKDGPFTFNTRRMSADPCEQPVVYFLDRVEEVGEGETLSSYKRYVFEPEKKCERAEYASAMAVQKIIVSAFKMHPNEWKKEPRRDCCEISKSLKKGTMHVRIRHCKRSETITTPT